MKLYRKKDECYATAIIKRHGFKCVDPDVTPTTEQIWEDEDGVQYKFTGWENTPNTALMAANPKYINLARI